MKISEYNSKLMLVSPIIKITVASQQKIFRDPFRGSPVFDSSLPMEIFDLVE